jgi:GR25 family glycosyltransferase involved in LPS biosynthesis
LYCIRHAKLHSYKKILICEDDVLFIDSVKTEFDKFIKNVPCDWSFLQLGNQFWATHWLERNKIIDNLYEFKWGTGSHCIGINNLIFNEAIQTLETYENPVDLLYYSLFKIYPAYCPDNFFADALSKNDHLNYNNSKEIFPSTIFHKNI